MTFDRFFHHKALHALLLATFIIVACGCNSSDEEEDEENVNVGGPANDILNEEGSLHLFKLHAFYQDAEEIYYDIMVLTFDNFRPAASNEEPDSDENPSLNDLGYSRDSWNESGIAWVSNSNPLLYPPYIVLRSWRVLKDNQLSSPVQRLNRPVYEAVDDNIFEQQLATRFVWDFDDYGTISAERDLAGDSIEDYETVYGFDFLEKATIWADKPSFANPDDFDFRFSEGAKLFGASRSVAAEVLVVESVYNNGPFELAPTRFGLGKADIDAAISAYPHGNDRLAYRFTVDYDQHRVIYMTFSLADDTVRFYNNRDDAFIAETDYTLESANSYIDMDTSALSESEREQLGLPAYFHPIITGPFAASDSSDQYFYYGKRYIATDAVNRAMLKPMLFVNDTARKDIKQAFEQWREQEHLDNQ